MLMVCSGFPDLKASNLWKRTCESHRIVCGMFFVSCFFLIFFFVSVLVCLLLGDARFCFSAIWSIAKGVLLKQVAEPF